MNQHIVARYVREIGRWSHLPPAEKALLRLAIPLLLAAGLAAATAPDFATAPAVSGSGAQTRIRFAATVACPVEVAILAADGKVLRHLAAGLLGPTAPEPLKPDALAQDLAWDGLDDRGRPAGGAATVRVRLGLTATFERFIGENRGEITGVRGLACAANGDLLVYQLHGALHPGDSTLQCLVLSREGAYQRTILPYPAGLPPEKLPGVKRLALPDGRLVPYIYHGECRELLPGAGELPMSGPVVLPNGTALVGAILDAQMRYPQPGQQRLLRVNNDGSIPAGGPLGVQLSASSRLGAFLALAPDGKTLYATGFPGEGMKADKAGHAVWRLDGPDASLKVFVGRPSEPGAGEGQLKEPSDVAVDAAGVVYVADHGNDRIAAFAPDGTFRGALQVTRPVRVKVHHKTGAIYVLSGPGVDQLQKFASLSAVQPLLTHKLPTFKHERYSAMLALDQTGPVLWVAPGSHYAGFGLLRIEEKDGAFAAPVDVAKPLAGKGIGAVMSLVCNKADGNLVVNSRLLDAQKGVWGKAPAVVAGTGIYPLDAGLDGNYYVQVYGNYMLRFDGQLAPLPFPTSPADAPKDKKGGVKDHLTTSARARGRGATANAAGEIYMIWQNDYSGTELNHIHLHNADGSIKQAKWLQSDIRSVSSVRLDPKGNVYLALGLRPGTDRLPSGLKGLVSEGPKDPDAVGGIATYPMIYGSIAKFSPAGGAIRKSGEGAPSNYAFSGKVAVSGAAWIYSGASPVDSWRTGSDTADICLCESPRFDVDGYGRSFFPDTARFRVGVLDTNGNEMLFFGDYGNPDSGGSGSAVPVPQIPIWWTECVAVGDDRVYIGDRLNRRIVVVKLAGAREKTLPLDK